jgi:Tfp pilus assembly protein PilF
MIIINILGFKKQKWNPSREHGVYLYDDETIANCLRRAKLFSERGDMDASKEEYANLVMMAPNNIEVLEKYVDFELKQGNSTAAEGYLYCLI